jgi:hypothetical protein
MDDATSAKAEAKDAAKKAAPKAALAQIKDIASGDPTSIDSVAGPPAAPIGYGVHKLATEGGNPYAAKQMYRAAEPILCDTLLVEEEREVPVLAICADAG